MNFDLKKEYYKILGIELYSKNKDIKIAYRNLSKKYHPDINEGEIEKFKEISDAYKVLSNVKLKQIYDIYLKLLDENPLMAETFSDMEFEIDMLLDMAKTMMPELIDEIEDISNNEDKALCKDNDLKELNYPPKYQYFAKEITPNFLDKELDVSIPTKVFENGLTIDIEKDIKLDISLELLAKTKEGYKVVYQSAGYKQNNQQGKLILTLTEVA